MPKRIQCQDLILEITRRCNMKCVHCLRGDAEDLDMPPRLIENIFKGVSRVRTLTFSGGEPSLVPEAMLTALRHAKKLGVPVESVYVVTNGKHVSGKFLQACREWHMHCVRSILPDEECLDMDMSHRILKTLRDDCEPYGLRVQLSMDRYHEDIPAESLARLCTLPNVGVDKYSPDEDDGWVLRMGRADFNGMGHEPLRLSDDISFAHWEGEDGPVASAEQIYVAADGAVTHDCNLSYLEQDGHAVEHIGVENPDPGWAERLFRKMLREEEKETMEQKLVEVRFNENEAMLLRFWFSDNEAAVKGCNACVGYSVYDPETLKETDGGEMDYDSAAKNYDTLDDALQDVLDFAFDGREPVSVLDADVDPDSLED